MGEYTSDTEALLDWLDNNAEATIQEVEPGALYLVREDGQARVLSTYEYDQFGPRGGARNVSVVDVRSFLDYWERWAMVNTWPEVWADPVQRRVVGIFDARNPLMEVDSADLGWGRHRIVLDPVKTDDWKDWVRASGSLLGQAEFAEFLEDHLPQIVEPDGARMLEIAQSLEGKTSVEWLSAHRLADGQIGLGYVETITAKAGARGELPVPSSFTLALRPFKGGDAYRVTARFRYRLAGEQIRLGFKLDRADDVEDSAWETVLEQLAGGLNEGRVPAAVRVGRP